MGRSIRSGGVIGGCRHRGEGVLIGVLGHTFIQADSRALRKAQMLFLKTFLAESRANRASPASYVPALTKEYLRYYTEEKPHGIYPCVPRIFPISAYHHHTYSVVLSIVIY